MMEQASTTVDPYAELVERIRAGDSSAMGELYTRQSSDALRVARIICPNGDAADLVADAFARVVDSIVGGGGPTKNFRAYFHAAIRNLNIERIRRAGRELAASDKGWLFDSANADKREIDEVDADHAARALQSLPDNWQTMLWKIEVQGRKPAEVAVELSVPVTKVSDTIYRAREGLRIAYLDQHVPSTNDSDCNWTRARLSRQARGRLSARAAAKVHNHLNRCAECAALYADIDQLNTRLGAALWPLVLVGGIAFLDGTRLPDANQAPVSDSTGGRLNLRVSRLSLRTSARIGAPFKISVLAAILVAATFVVGITAHARWLSRDDALIPLFAALAIAPDPTQDSPDPAQDNPVVLPRGPAIMPRIFPLPSKTETPRADASSTPPKPEPELEPVDLKIGNPTVTADAVLPFHWRLNIPIFAAEGAKATGFTIALQLTLSDIAGFVERLSTAWDCGPVQDGDEEGNPYFFDTVTCRFTYQPGKAVPSFRLLVESISAPSGSIDISGQDNADPDTSTNHRTF